MVLLPGRIQYSPGIVVYFRILFFLLTSGKCRSMVPLTFQCDGAWWLPLTGLSWLPYALGSCARGSTIFPGTFPKLIYC